MSSHSHSHESHDPAELVATMGRAMQAEGYRLTQSRQDILETLVTTGGHLSADDLSDQVRAAHPNVGRMTVYRTLDLLVELGLVRPIYQGTGAAHFVLMPDGHHHHLVCSDCGLVVEFENCTIGVMEKELSERYGFELSGHLVEFFGRCRDCRE